MAKLTQIFWKLFLFTFPFSLHFVLYEEATYRFGNFNPWVTGFLFLPEILLIFIFLIRFFTQLRITNYELRETSSFRPKRSVVEKSIPILCLLFLLNAAFITYWQGDLWLFGFFTFHIFSGGLVYFFLKKEIIPPEQSVRWLLFGALFQVLLAFFQFKLNHSVGFSILGEPNLSPDILNVAKNNLADGIKAIRGYGTFLHPNILGVYLMTVLFIALPYLKKIGLIFWPLILLGGIYFTGSRAAELTTLILFFFLFIFKLFKNAVHKKMIVFGFLALFFSANAWFFFNSAQLKTEDSSLAERIQQNGWSHDMALSYPWGVGTGNFTLKTEEISPTKLMPWEFQPVHNVYFLTLNELGIQGLILLLGMLILILNSYFQRATSYFQILPFLGLIIVASFDHLLWTSYIGPFIVALALSQMRVKI